MLYLRLGNLTPRPSLDELTRLDLRTASSTSFSCSLSLTDYLNVSSISNIIYSISLSCPSFLWNSFTRSLCYFLSSFQMLSLTSILSQTVQFVDKQFLEFTPSVWLQSRTDSLTYFRHSLLNTTYSHKLIFSTKALNYFPIAICSQLLSFTLS